MTPETIGLIVQGGIGAVLLFVLWDQNKRFDRLQQELNKIRNAQWDLIVSLVGEHRAKQITTKPGDSSTNLPSGK